MGNWGYNPTYNWIRGPPCSLSPFYHSSTPQQANSLFQPAFEGKGSTSSCNDSSSNGMVRCLALQRYKLPFIIQIGTTQFLPGGSGYEVWYGLVFGR